MGDKTLFKVDLVYTWVNGEDQAYQSKCNQHAEGEIDLNPERFRDSFHLLKYSLRSIEQYIPWVDKIYIVTQRPQIPNWLDVSHPRVNIIHHDEIIDSEYLPTFNSNVIESYIHKIPQLSDSFLYMNDDFLFLKHSKKDIFLSHSGKHSVFGTLIGENLFWRIYEQKHNYLSLGHLEHCPILLTKQLWEGMYQIFPNKTHLTRSHRFRKKDDLVAHKLYRYYMLKYQKSKSRVITYGKLRKLHRFHRIKNNLQKQELALMNITAHHPNFICLNDDLKDHPNKEVISFVKDWLEDMLPDRSTFELS